MDTHQADRGDKATVHKHGERRLAVERMPSCEPYELRVSVDPPVAGKHQSSLVTGGKSNIGPGALVKQLPCLSGVLASRESTSRIGSWKKSSSSRPSCSSLPDVEAFSESSLSLKSKKGDSGSGLRGDPAGGTNLPPGRFLCFALLGPFCCTSVVCSSALTIWSRFGKSQGHQALCKGGDMRFRRRVGPGYNKRSSQINRQYGLT